MKVLVLCYEYPPVGGGGGRIAERVAAGLAARGHDIRTVTAGMRHLPREELRDGVRILRPRSFRRREDTCSVPEMGLYLATSLLPALDLCRNWKPDVIHAHFVVPTGALAHVLTKFTGIPHVLTAHLGDVPGGVPEQTGALFKILGPAIRPIWSAAADITAVSSHVAALAEAASGRPARVILNGMDTIPPACPDKDKGPVRIIMLGRLSIQKDPALAVQALARLQHQDWSCEIIGDGPLRQSASKLATEAGIANRVTFSGWLPSSAIAERLKSAHILLMTSSHEGLPVAGIEALANGLAIVGSNIGGLSDIVVDRENGFLVRRTPQAFAEALDALIDDRGLLERMGRASHTRAALFRLGDRVADYEQVLLSAARSQIPRSAPSPL